MRHPADLNLFRPAAHVERLPADRIDPVYRRLRWQLFVGIFTGYAGYYLVRKNFTLAMPFLIEEGGYSRGELGLALSAVSIAYGLSKFLMGNVSDRSNPRYFLSTGLCASALIMLCFGLVPWATGSITAMFVLLFVNGWFQGMGWPACGRTIVHWWSHRERGSLVSVWNVAHNVGGGLIGPLFVFGLWAFSDDWHSAFYVPASMALLVSLFVLVTMRDTPQSCGLPPIEEYKDDYSGSHGASQEEELSAKEIFFRYVFRNKLLWCIACANAFVYLIRYGVLDWAPVYLKEAKGFEVDKSSMAYFLYEWAGIPGTLLCGWMSDRFFAARRAPAGILFMALVGVALMVYRFNPEGNPTVDMIALVAIGFLIYGPVMLIGLYALELVPKKAAGTAAGLTGLFGYLGGAVAANVLLGHTVDRFGWDGGFALLGAGCVLAIVFLLIAYLGERAMEKRAAST